ncbi:hypothetical protein ACFX2A_019375 [Malus domestica]
MRRSRNVSRISMTETNRFMSSNWRSLQPRLRLGKVAEKICDHHRVLVQLSDGAWWSRGVSRKGWLLTVTYDLIDE